jgi:hypothetical protein
MKEGKSHPDRNAQFEYINERAKDFIARGLPFISVDTKKKEAVGEFANHGREWQPKGKPVEVLTYDFTSDSTPKAIPYGVYDVANNDAFVNVGTDHDTPMFAVHSIERWWSLMGSGRYPKARELFITADAGGSNSRRSHSWKAQLQEMADRHALSIHVSHFPPGTSKWNKIEHRLFSHITLNWRARPLISYETVVSLIAGTSTRKGLKVSAELDEAKYPVGIKVKRAVMQNLALETSTFQGTWNYTLRPRTPEQIAVATITEREEKATRSHEERRAFWRALIEEQRASGLSNRAFCRQRKLPFDTFIAARRRLVGRMRARSKTDN